MKHNANPEAEWFGYTRVAGDKTARVKDVFASVAGSYDLMNDLMSLGVHRLWKRTFVKAIDVQPGERCLDVAGGTGDIAFALHKAGGQVTVCDINPEMLKVGKARAIDRGLMNKLDWVEGNAECLPFKARTFDVYTIAFGLRNVAHIDDALHDAARVLKPGGRFYCLEFAPVTTPGLKEAYDIYSFTVLPWLGAQIANDRASYQYLAESIRQMPAPEALAKRLEKAGFAAVTHRALSGGIAVIHSGIRV